MKKRLAAFGLSAMVLGALVLPASPAKADHCFQTSNTRDQIACTWDHVGECVSTVIRDGGACIDWN